MSQLVRKFACGLLALLALSVSSAFAQRELKDIPDPDPEIERKSFIVADGFEVNLFAADPLLHKPIQMNFDPQGRLWIAASEVYPQIAPGQKANDKILVLEDTDGDSRSDKTTVFADGLLIPTGVEPGDGGAYVAASTELLHLKDTDGDGKADESRVVLSGFGTEDTHHILHTLRWGTERTRRRAGQQEAAPRRGEGRAPHARCLRPADSRAERSAHESRRADERPTRTLGRRNESPRHRSRRERERSSRRGDLSPQRTELPEVPRHRRSRRPSWPRHAQPRLVRPDRLHRRVAAGPNKKVKENFNSLVVVTDDGKVRSGIKLRQTDTDLLLRDTEDNEFAIPLKKIEEQTNDASLMPAGLADKLTRTELIDLVRFLSELGKSGDFQISKQPLVRRWQTLAPTEAAIMQLRRVSYASVAQNDAALTWTPAYAKVSGELPLNELSELRPPLPSQRRPTRSGLHSLRTRCHLTRPGEVVVEFDRWADRMARR